MIEPVDLTRVRLDPELLLTALAEAGVEFVVIGGIATILHGDIELTQDVDATVRHSQRNFEVLARVLRDLDARLLVALNGTDVGTVDVPITADTFPPLTSGRFLTKHGVLDVVLRPDGVTSYDEWAASAVEVELATGESVLIGSLDDIITSKTAANRRKHEEDLPRLRALREVIQQQQGRTT